MWFSGGCVVVGLWCSGGCGCGVVVVVWLWDDGG